jgi:hypothetical protein
MSHEQTQEKTSPEATSILQSRPQRRSRRGLATLLFLLGALVIAGVIAIIAWQALSLHHPSTSSSVTGTSTPASNKGNSSNSTPPGWNDPVIYWQTIREQAAQGLHLTVAQVTAKLRAAGAMSTPTPLANKNSAAPDTGAPMTAVAVQQGISTDQLRTIELNALRKACDVMVAQGKLAQADADQRMQMFEGWDQGTLNWYVTHAFTSQ